MNDNERENIVSFLECMGLDSSESGVEQMSVMVEALKLFQERNARYNDLWKRDGWLGNVFQMTHKASRIRRLFFDQLVGVETPDPDDAFDLINYSIFFLRCLRDGNRTGN